MRSARLMATAPIMILFCVAVSAIDASERATLSNGFIELCDHHAVVDGRIRLYLDPAEGSYIELPSSQIGSIEMVPATGPQRQPLQEQGARPSPVNALLTPADLNQMLARASAAYDLDIDLLASVIKAESDGNPRAVSRAGAQGLMQLMPQTATSMGVRDRLAPNENVQGGSAYLNSLLTRYHENLALALAAYNAGPEAVDKYHGIPPYHETRAYVARVIHEFNRRVQTRGGAGPEDRSHANPVLTGVR